MNRPAGVADEPLDKCWRLFFGVAILAATPILVFVGAAFVAAQIPLLQGSSFASYLGRWAILGVSFVSFLMACMWRRKHRSSSSSLFPAEVIVSIIFGVGFMVILFLALYAAIGAD